MPFPPDSRVLALLSAFDDTPALACHRYSPAPRCEGRRYTYHSRSGDLAVNVWTHSGTAWVSLHGLLSRRAAHALLRVLTDADTEARDIVLNAAELELPSASGGTPLITLCATLSYAGYSVCVVGREDDVVAAGAESHGGRPHLLVVATG